MSDTTQQNEFEIRNENDNDVSGTVQFGASAPSQHDADTMPLTEFSLTRDDVVLMYLTAGIDAKPRTVSRYAQEGLLLAQKVDAERGLKRYLFNKGSVEEDIERRKRGPNPVYATIDAVDDEDDDATMSNEIAASSAHGATTEQSSTAPVHEGARTYELELQLARAEARSEEKDARHVEDLKKINELAEQNGQLRISLGKYMGRNEELEAQLLRLATGNKDDEPTPGADHDDGAIAESEPQ
jgi:hypothetical protein